MSLSDLAPDPRVAGVAVTGDRLVVDLKDGRSVSAPLSWFPRLAAASPADLADWEPSAAGHGIHWPRLDEDIGVEGLLRGTPSTRV